MVHQEVGRQVELINAGVEEVCRRMAGRTEPMTDDETREVAQWLVDHPELEDVIEALKAYQQFRKLQQEEI